MLVVDMGSDIQSNSNHGNTSGLKCAPFCHYLPTSSFNYVFIFLPIRLDLFIVQDLFHSFLYPYREIGSAY